MLSILYSCKALKTVNCKQEGHTVYSYEVVSGITVLVHISHAKILAIWIFCAIEKYTELYLTIFSVENNVL